MMKDRQTGKPAGFAFCQFHHWSEAHVAIQQLNGQEFQLRMLKVAPLVGNGDSSNLGIVP